MKKIFTYFAALTTLLAVSCNRIELNDFNQDGTLTISLNAGDLETRADDEKQTAEEKVIDHFDYFFFSDVEGTDLIVSGRQSGTTKTFDTTSEEYKKLANKSYLYVIANYPEAIPEGTDTKEELLNLPVGVSITAHPNTPFVMDSYDADNDNVLIELVPAAANEARVQKVMMRRIAAKFVVNITVAASAESAGGLKWKPTTNTKDFYIYLVNALDDATVSGAPIVGANVEDESKFYTYPHKHTDMTGADLSWVSAVSYAYPETFAASDQKAPYFKVQMPWVHVNNVNQPATGSNIGSMGTHMFYYKVIFPEITEITRNTLYTLNLTIDKVGGTAEDYVIVTGTDLMVTNWLSPSGQFTGYYSARFLDTAREVYYFYGDDEMEIPVTSSHPIAVDVTSATKTTYNLDTGAEVTTNVTDYTKSANGKSSFTITKTLHTDITDKDTFDYTPITYLVTLTHSDGNQPHEKTVTVIQYPPVYVYRDQSNGYAYVNSYANSNVSGGRYSSNRAYNSSGTEDSNQIGTMNYLGETSSLNNNNSQYVVTVSVLPEHYTIAGLTPIIGDPRGGTLSASNLGYTSTSGSQTVNVRGSYNAVSKTTQNVIAPQIRIASSWGATGMISSYDRSEERCAAYQENGYPAGRWRVPTVAEIDFLISLSEYEYIPSLFTVGQNTMYTRSGNYYNYTYTANHNYFDAYWSNGPSIYVGSDYLTNHSQPFETASASTTSRTAPNRGNWYVFRNGEYLQYGQTRNYVTANDELFDIVVRCVYDQWYWGEEKYNNNKEKITEDTTNKTPATQWIGYIF